MRKKIKVHPLIYPVLFVFLFSGQLQKFLVLILFVTIHELCHIITAVFLGAKFSEIMITPVGERAVIKNMEKLSYERRIAIVLAGPGVSLLLGIFFLLCFPNSNSCLFLSTVNFCIGFFNLLPFLPMDGGNFLLIVLGKRFGTLRTAEILIKVSSGFGYFLILAGIAQVILFPFNISLLMIGFYFKYSNKREYIHITFRFYKALLAHKKGCGRGQLLECRRIMVNQEEKICDILKRISIDYYTIFCFMKNGKIIEKPQSEIMEQLIQKGGNITISG